MRALRVFSAFFLVTSLLASAAGAGAVLADDLADMLSPTDDPATPSPDLYKGRSLDDGIPDMPDPVAMSFALPIAALAPQLQDRPLEPAEAEALPESLRADAPASRGPPSSRS